MKIHNYVMLIVALGILSSTGGLVAGPRAKMQGAKEKAQSKAQTVKANEAQKVHAKKQQVEQAAAATQSNSQSAQPTAQSTQQVSQADQTASPAQPAQDTTVSRGRLRNLRNKAQ